MSLTVKLEIYEGPLDLLLHLIKKNEVDIYDIPITLITSQYLEYLELLESLNIEIAGEFLLMAATLTQIKSRMLLPDLDSNDEVEGEETADPREEIVRALLEHMKMKDAAEALERREILNRDVFVRQVSLAELGIEPENEDMVEANLFDLIDAFRRLVTSFDGESSLRIRLETKNIKQRISEIIDLLRTYQDVSFETLCASDRTRAEVVLSFLSILELARVGVLRIYQHQVTKQIMLFFVNPPQDSPSGDRLPEELDGLDDGYQ
jgi:segregation and condensation protein A